VHQTGHKNGAEHPAVCYPYSVSPCQNWELFFIKAGVKVNGQYD